MKRTALKHILNLILILSTVSSAQNWQEMPGLFSPTGLEMKHFTAPFFFDYDNDGDIDLTLCSLSGRGVLYINNPVNGKPSYTPDPAYLAQIALLEPNKYYSYAVHADLDNDGRPDLITAGFTGLTLFYNKGTLTQPDWIKDSLLFAPVNSLIGSDAKPELGDLDGDGDLDLLVGTGESLLGGPEPGITLGFRNTGSNSLPSFELYPAFVTGLPDIGRNSYPALSDVNGDGKLDLLLGRDLSSFTYFRNNGTVNEPVWVSQSNLFVVENSHYWKNPDFTDIDGDGDNDLVYGTDQGNLICYQNTGTVTSPVYTYNGSFFPVAKVSGNSTVSLADYDGDGDLDLLTGADLGQVRLVRNTGTATAPAFELTAGNLGNISFSSQSFPRFVDIDKDGDLDIVSGAFDGKIYVYLKNGSGYSQNTSMFGTVDIGWSSVPAPVDIDNDGDIDMLVGAEANADVKFYENTGNNVYVLNTSFMSGVNFGSYNKPSFADIDNDGDQDLLIGSLWGTIKYYENTGTPELPVWVQNTQIIGTLERDQSSVPFAADIDGDTRPDLVIGDADGNFIAYKNMFAPVGVEDEIAGTPGDFRIESVYPNPFNPMTKVKVNVSRAGELLMQLITPTGEVLTESRKEISAPGTYEFTADMGSTGAATGFYILRCIMNGKSSFFKVLYLK